MNKRQVLAYSTLAVAVLLSACGGGSSESSSVSQTVSGSVIKGPLNRAKVTAYKVKDDGHLGDKLGETVSGADGSYVLDFKDYSGVVVVEATVTDSTLMYDEATGQNIKPATGFKLRAAVNSTGGTFTAQINPLSEVAVVAAEKKGSFNRANVEQANKDLRESVGFDPLTEKPGFDDQGQPNNKAAVAMAAISKMAASDDLTACASQTTQAAKVKCVVDEVAKKGLSDDTVKRPFVNHAAGVADQAGLPDTAKPVVTDPTGTTPTATPLEQAKAFMGTLRSNAKALDAADMSLQTELQTVASDVQDRLAPFTESTLDALDLATQGARFWAAFQANPNLAFPVLASFSRNGIALGGCRLYSDTDYLKEATNQAGAKYVACGTSSPLFWDASLNNMVAWSTRVRLHPSTTTADQFTVYTQTRRAIYLWNPTAARYEEPIPWQRVHFGAAFPGNAATLKAERNAAGDINKVQFVGEMAPPFEQVNSDTSPYIITTVLGNKLKVDLAGQWTVDAAGVNTLALQGSVAQYKTVNTVDTLQTELALESGSYIKGTSFELSSSYVDSPLEPLALAAAMTNDPSEAFDGSHEILLKLRFATANSVLKGQLFMGNFVPDASKTVYQPTKMSFSGSVARKGAAFFEGSVTAEQPGFSTFRADVPVSASNPEKMTTTLAGKVSIPNRPPMAANVVLSKTDNGTSWTATTSGQYRQGALVVNLNGQSSSAGANQFTLASSDGIQMVIDANQTTYTMTKSGTAVGVFNSTTNRLTYSDNTYEQF